MNIDKSQYITADYLNLPKNANELSNAEDKIEKLKIKIEKINKHNSINNVLHEKFYEEIIKVLYYVGELSMPAFAIEDELEETYSSKYKHTPELAKQLWLDHYQTIHYPYTLLKNRCFRMLDYIDDTFFEKFKKHPDNWKA